MSDTGKAKQIRLEPGPPATPEDLAAAKASQQEPRISKSIRLSAQGVRLVEEIAKRYDVDFSTAARRMLAKAYPLMPDTWPTKEF